MPLLDSEQLDDELAAALMEKVDRERYIDSVLMAWGDWADNDGRLIGGQFRAGSIFGTFCASSNIFETESAAGPVRARDQFSNRVYMQIEDARQRMNPIERLVMGMKYRELDGEDYMARKLRQIVNNERDKLNLPRMSMNKAGLFYLQVLDSVRSKVERAVL